MSLLDRIAPAPRTDDAGRGAPAYALALGYGLLAPVAFALLLFVPVLASWTLDPRTSTEWVDALAITSTVFALTMRGSISVSHNGIDALHFSPMLLVVLQVVLARFAYRPVQHALDEEQASGDTQQRTAFAFLVGFLVSAVVVTVISLSGPAPAKPWTVVPGAVMIALTAVAWSVLRDGAGVSMPWVESLTDRLHLNVRRAFRPAGEGLTILMVCSALLVFALVMNRLERVGKVAALLDMGGGGIALLWIAQLFALPNLVVFAGGWLTGGSVLLGSGQLSTTAATPTILPSIPVLGALPESGPLPGAFRFIVLVPVLVGAFMGWRATASMPSLTHLGRKVQVAASAAGVASLGLAVLLWWSRAGMSPGQLSVIGPSVWTLLLAAVEFTFGAMVAAVAVHFKRRLR